MTNFILLFLFLLVGYWLRKYGIAGLSLARGLNFFVINIALPAVMIVKLHAITLGEGAVTASLMPWIFFLTCLGVFAFIGNRRRWSRRKLGAVVLTAGLCNTSFLGYPMLEALYGEAAYETAIIVDQAGSFLLLSTVGLLVAAILSAKNFSLFTIIKRIITFTPFLAAIGALLLRPVPLDPRLTQILDLIGQTLGPASLISIGLQLNFNRSIVKRYRFELITGLSFKLALAPAFILALYYYGFDLTGLAPKVIVLESAMAPMITGAIVATNNNLEPELANLITGAGIVLSFVTVPLWFLLLKGFQ